MGKFLLARVNFWSEHKLFLFFFANGKNIKQQAVRGKIILSWFTFQGSVTLHSLGIFTQTDVVYPAWVWLPSFGMVTQAGLPSLGKITHPG